MGRNVPFFLESTMGGSNDIGGVAIASRSSIGVMGVGTLGSLVWLPRPLPLLGWLFPKLQARRVKKAAVGYLRKQIQLVLGVCQLVLVKATNLPCDDRHRKVLEAQVNLSHLTLSDAEIHAAIVAMWSYGFYWKCLNVERGLVVLEVDNTQQGFS